MGNLKTSRRGRSAGADRDEGERRMGGGEEWVWRVVRYLFDAARVPIGEGWRGSGGEKAWLPGESRRREMRRELKTKPATLCGGWH